MHNTVDIHDILRQTLFVAVKLGAPSLLASLVPVSWSRCFRP